MDRVIELLFTQWDALEQLIKQIPVQQWSAPSILPGWTNADILAHIIGTELFLDGETPPDVSLVPGRSYRNEVARLNDRWVTSMRALSPEELTAKFSDTTAKRRQSLAALDEQALSAVGWTPVGEAPLRRFLEIRVFDCYVHEQDLRSSTNIKGGTSGPVAEFSMDEVERALGYIVGKQARLPRGTTVRIQLTGDLQRTWNIEVGDRARLVPVLETPMAELTIDAAVFLSLACGRLSASSVSDDVRVAGDYAIAHQIVEHLAFTI